MTTPTKEEILKVYQAYLNQMSHHVDHALDNFPPVLDQKIKQELDQSHQHLTKVLAQESTSAMIGIQSTTRNIETIQGALKNTFDKLLKNEYERNAELKEKLTQLKGNIKETKQTVEQELKQFKR